MAISKQLPHDAVVINGKMDPLLINGGTIAKTFSISFLSDLQDVWRKEGKQVLKTLADKDPRALFSGAVALTRVIKWETEQDTFGSGMTPEEVVDKLERRAGPEARKLFERFLRQLNELHAKQVEAQDAEEVE